LTNRTTSSGRPAGRPETVHQKARALVAAGISVIPTRRDGTKAPDPDLLPLIPDPSTGKRHRSWDPFKERLPTDAELCDWFGRPEPAGIGVVGGKVSGNLEQLDFDTRAEETFPAWCAMVEEERTGLVARLSVAETPREPAGYHVRYRCPEVTIPGNTKRAEESYDDPKTGKPRKRVLIETRAEGGYAVSPGSPAEVHETGRPYRHHSGPPLEEVPSITAAEREVLIRCARYFDRGAPTEDQTRQPPAHGLKPGEDYDRRGPDWAEILESAGWSLAMTRGQERRWRRPDKATGWSATTGHCSSNGADLLRVFSSNAHPFEDGKCYGKFRAYALLRHGGDLAAAAKALAAEGYGDQRHQRNGATPKDAGGSSEGPVGPAKPEPWGDAVHVEAPPAEPFPLDALPRAMRGYVEQFAAALPAPVDLVALPALGAASAAIGNARHLQVKEGWTEGPRLWLAAVCDAGAKKSPALSGASGPVRDRQRVHKHDYVQARAKYEQALKKYEASKRGGGKGGHPAAGPKNAGAARPEEPKMSQILAADTTREALVVLLEDNPRGLLVQRDELAGWACGLNQYKQKGDDRQFWLTLWSGAEILVNRAKDRGRPTAYITNPMLSIVGCLPPSVLGLLQDEREHQEDGFVHRILFAWPDRVPLRWTNTVPHPDAVKAYKDLFEALFKLDLPLDDGTKEPRPRLLKWTAGGLKAWAEHVGRIAADLNDPEFPDSLRGPWAKLEGYGARLALVLHVCRFVTGETTNKNVDEISMRNAAKLIAYFQSHARRVYPLLGSASAARLAKDMEAVLGWVRRRGANSFTWNQCYRDLSGRFETAERLEEVLRALADRNLVREKPQERKGDTGRRPKPAYEVNPTVFATKPTKPTKQPPPAEEGWEEGEV
jgi:hypothetical protein